MDWDADETGALRSCCADLLDAWSLDEEAKQQIKAWSAQQLQTTIQEFQPDESGDVKGQWSAFVKSKGWAGGATKKVKSSESGSKKGTKNASMPESELDANGGWKCKCGWQNNAKNLICGGKGIGMGCKAAKPSFVLPEGAWLCHLCGWQNKNENLLCGGRGDMGCKAPSQALMNAVENPGEGPSDDEMQSFARIWGVDEGATNFLLTMSPIVRTHVVTNFKPPENTTNISGQVISFAKNAMDAVKEAKGKGKGMGTGADKGMGMGGKGGKGAMGMDPATMMSSMMGMMMMQMMGKMGGMKGKGKGMKGKSGMGGMGGMGGSESVENFIQQWGLDEENANMLRGADPARQQLTIQNFNPPADTTNINAKFRSFFTNFQNAQW
eukprot:gnl/MRDRNA2_/MRDRNA2_35381_c0_seq1.p1 gnl/MRDRNA2_/MRDRNA2_35381_c0~~gnl/MRDRNA2_/MRDRNA2_35381_c0_seq1.p1  ORF type:complete len:382 (-),score=96.89 gnl/MRDRNA2_/MRDRNA2_35381_c0_seq1:166-1311(-)